MLTGVMIQDMSLDIRTWLLTPLRTAKPSPETVPPWLLGKWSSIKA